MKPFAVSLLVVALLLITETIAFQYMRGQPDASFELERPDTSMPQGLDFQSCSSGWFDYPEQNICLRFTPTKMTVKEAEQFCSLAGGNLLSVWLMLNSKVVLSVAKAFNHQLPDVWVSVPENQSELIARVLKSSTLAKHRCPDVMKETDSALDCVALRNQEEESECWDYVDCNTRLQGVCFYHKPNEKNPRR